jgi:hypothetical protein
MTDAPEYLRAGDIARLSGASVRGASLDCRRDSALGEGARHALGATKGTRAIALAPAMKVPPRGIVRDLTLAPTLRSVPTWHHHASAAVQPMPSGVKKNWMLTFARNETRTHCYHFATQLGSTGWYGPEQGEGT